MQKHEMMDKIIQYQMRKIKTSEVAKFLDEYTEAFRQPLVSGSVLSVRIEETLAKYWYDTEYNFIDKTDHKKAEESRKMFRKWIDENLEAFVL